MINFLKYPQSLESNSTVSVVNVYKLPCFGTFSARSFCFTYYVFLVSNGFPTSSILTFHLDDNSGNILLSYSSKRRSFCSCLIFIGMGNFSKLIWMFCKDMVRLKLTMYKFDSHVTF